MKAMNKIMAMLAAAALAACMCAMPLSAEQPPEEEAWEAVTSLEQLDGAWAGTAVRTVPVKEYVGSMWDSYLESVFGAGAKVTMALTETYIINAAAQTSGGPQTVTYTFSGGNTAANWAAIRVIFVNIAHSSGYTVAFDDLARTVIADTFFDPSPVGGDVGSFLAKYEINRDGTKIRQPVDGDSPEIIYTRQLEK
jgi:hypothetical protein